MADYPTKEKLTVESKAKIELVDTKVRENASLLLCFFKWICACVLFFLILFSLVVSKLTLISLGHILKPNVTKTSPTIATTTAMPTTAKPTTTATTIKASNLGDQPLSDPINYEADVAYTMIMLFMLIPHFVSFIRAFRRSAFSSIELWPGRMSLFTGILAAVFETVGLCLFSLVVIPYMKNSIHSISLMNGVFVIPIFVIMVKEFRKGCCNQSSSTEENIELRDVVDSPSESEAKEPTQKNWITLLFFSFSTMCSIAGISFLLYLVYSKKDKDNMVITMVTIPISIFLLSIAWCPQISKYQIIPGKISCGRNQEKRKMNIRSARQRMTLISSSIKLVLTFVIAILLNFLNLTNSDNREFPLINGFKHFFTNKRLYTLFFLQVFSSLIGYLATWTVCKINLQKTCVVFPYLLSTPLAIVITAPRIGICKEVLDSSICPMDDQLEYIIPLCLLLWISSLGFSFQFFKSQQFLMAKEEVLFWLPTYDSILLEQHVLLNRKSEYTDERFINYRQIVKESRIYICTTMYHEADFEMEQLLNSIAEVAEAGEESKRQMEAHIFFDDGARENVILMYALQLLSLLKQTVHVDPKDATIYETPYGLQLNYVLRHGMKFVVHLKDNIKVKNKKRWSQVMYMSYILDYKGKKDKVSDDLSFVLATDADVKFSHTDVMALMDFMSRDPNIAAVCGRTHPMGSGPLVWYQIFDYAIGHWLQKVANDVLGTVLCSPGCFSVYRASAIRDVLPLYATNVNSPMDFLMKDMGEDRWFCTLLIEAGWRIEYCASAADSTYCPDEFEEFFKQRRRWGPSTFANQVEVINKHRIIRQNNDSISMFFMCYQGFLLLASVIGPSTILLFMAAGLQFAFPDYFNMIAVLIFLIIVTIFYALICMYCTAKTQITTAKLLTFFFGIIMAVTAVGCLTQISADISKVSDPPTIAPLTIAPTPFRWRPPPPTKIKSTRSYQNLTTIAPIYDTNEYIFQVTTWYSMILLGIFILTGLLHGDEVVSLIYGVLYWLSLPTGHLLLTIYSIANLTDRTWGTREGKQRTYADSFSWRGYISSYLRYIFRCCIPPEHRMDNNSLYTERVVDDIDDSTIGPEDSPTDPDSDAMEMVFEGQTDGVDGDGYEEETEYAVPETSIKIANVPAKDVHTNKIPIMPPTSRKPYANAVIPIQPLQLQKTARRLNRKKLDNLEKRRSQPIYHRFKSLQRQITKNDAVTVEEWLPREYKKYAKNFIEHGYDNASFIAGSVKEKDLIDMGIMNRGHRKKIMVLIDMLPPNEILHEVPVDVEEWLINLGLHEYWGQFKDNSYTEQRDLADLKHMTEDQIATWFAIKKRGHLRKLVAAARNLQYATKAQKLIRETRMLMSKKPVLKMKLNDAKENKFWEHLREICLLPEQAAFNKSNELGDKLAEMRTSSFAMLLIVNTLWLTFMGTVMYQGPKLHVMGSSFAAVAFTFIYAIILIAQFLALLVHRVTTFIHFIARAPFTPGKIKRNWAWNDDQIHDAPNEDTLREFNRATLRFERSVYQNRRM